MRVALYARVSTESQQAWAPSVPSSRCCASESRSRGDEPVAEFCDDGHSGARLDWPGLDALRDAAEVIDHRAGVVPVPGPARPRLRLPRIVLDELASPSVSVRFTDAPPIDDDPQAKPLTQVQGVIAEYERAKIAERYRRGKLFRSRNGEVLAWRTPYGYRRHPRDAHGPARLVVFEPEAAIVRRIFDDSPTAGTSREIIRRLAADGVPSPTGSRGSGAPRLRRGCCATRPTSGGSTSTAPRPSPTRAPGGAAHCGPRPRED